MKRFLKDDVQGPDQPLSTSIVGMIGSGKIVKTEKSTLYYRVFSRWNLEDLGILRLN